MWWAAPPGSEPGWGIYLVYEGDTILATWFTFGLDGKPLWLVAAATRVGANVYTGTLYTGTGPAFNAIPFDPSKVIGTAVGTATFTFAGDDAATFAYTVSGVSQTNPITPERFGEADADMHVGDAAGHGSGDQLSGVVVGCTRGG